MSYFGVTPSEVKRFKREAIQGMKSKGKKDKKNYNFGVSKADVIRYRKQVTK